MSRRWVRLLVIAVAVALVVVLLFTVVFPLVDRMLADPTLGTSGASGLG